MSVELFKKLVEIPSVSGNESLFQQLVSKEFASYSEVKFSDVLNNFTVEVGGGKEKVLITAHADEVGFIVTYIDEDGFIYFQPVGGVDADVAVGQVVKVLTQSGPISGIIGKEETFDTASAEADSEIVPYKDLWIDIGDTGKAKELVSVGDDVVYDMDLRLLPNNFFLARGADDKVGVYALIELIRSFGKKPNPEVSLFAVTTTQEEIGSRGAQPAVNKISPKYSIIIDTIAATDTPLADREEIGDIRLGAGPAISRGSNTNADLFVILEALAKRENIPYQVNASAGPSSTDADPIQISGIGTATIVVSIPVRYTHFPGEIFSWSDLDGCIKLIGVFLQSLKGGV